MSTLTKVALGMVGQLRGRPAQGESATSLKLPPPALEGGVSLMEALVRRRSTRQFESTELPIPVMSKLLWAAAGINRRGGGRTAPSALDTQAVDVYVTLATGAYLYEPGGHSLQRVAAEDLRRLTGYQEFVDDAPVDLVYVADHRRMKLVPPDAREGLASVTAGAMAQNVYLLAASERLATVVRSWLDRDAVARALGLGPDQHVLLSQTIGVSRRVH